MSDSNSHIPLGYCQCGCGRRTKLASRSDPKTGAVRGQPRRFLRGHHNKQGPDYVVDSASGCWLWRRSLNPNGYGSILVNGRKSGAHRVFWERFKGPVPVDLHVLHKCDTPHCVNPEHLFLGTHDDNMQDMWEKGRGRPGHQYKVTPEIVAIIRTAKPLPGRRAIDYQGLAKRFGVSHWTIRAIRNNRAWREPSCPISRGGCLE